MNGTIYFLWNGGWTSKDIADIAKAEERIRYWLNKSQGMNEMLQILVVPESAKGNWTDIQMKMCLEEVERQERLQAQEDEWLHQKYAKK